MHVINVKRPHFRTKAEVEEQEGGEEEEEKEEDEEKEEEEEEEFSSIEEGEQSPFC